MSGFGYTKMVHGNFEEIIDDVRFSLSGQGFGVLTYIDMQEKFKEKINKDIEKYVVLGACNPGIAYEAMKYEMEIGLMIPCNVIVYEKESNIYVSCILPSQSLSLTGNQELIDVAKRAEKKLITAIDAID